MVVFSKCNIYLRFFCQCLEKSDNTPTRRIWDLPNHSH